MRRNSFWTNFFESKAFCTFAATATGFAVTALCLLGFSYLMTRIDASQGVISVMSALSLCSGTFLTGYVYTNKRRKNGLITGLFCGLLCYCIVFLFGIFFFSAMAGSGILLKLVIAGICGSFGGVVGVNSKRKFRFAKKTRHHY